MKLVLCAAAFVLAALATTSVTAGKTEPRMIIRNDRGGYVQSYVDKYAKDARAGTRYAIDGQCSSSCSLILDQRNGLDVCVTPNAYIGIHKPFAWNKEENRVSDDPFSISQARQLWWVYFYPAYPDWLKAIMKRSGVPSVHDGAQPSEILIIGFDILSQHYPVCKVVK